MPREQERREERKLLFSVTSADCDWQYFRCPGNGGQNVNKVESGVRCVHRKSGAKGRSCDTRDQFRNKRLAFRRMVETKEFQTWHRLEIAKRTGEYDSMLREVEETITEMMNEKNLRIETYAH